LKNLTPGLTVPKTLQIVEGEKLPPEIIPELYQNCCDGPYLLLVNALALSLQ
jgi:hypothetical protein